jgi:hypothetical protein
MAYFSAMSDGNEELLRDVLGRRVLIVEAGTNDSLSDVLATRTPGSLFPPERNDDWSSLRVHSLEIHQSAMHPSVASVSFAMDIPNGSEAISNRNASLADGTLVLNDDDRKRIPREIQAKGHSTLEGQLCWLDRIENGK